MAKAKYSYNLADTLQAPILAKALNKYINGQHAFSKSLRLKRYMHGAWAKMLDASHNMFTTGPRAVSG
jgi:hypothetical protein